MSQSVKIFLGVVVGVLLGGFGTYLLMSSTLAPAPVAPHPLHARSTAATP